MANCIVGVPEMEEGMDTGSLLLSWSRGGGERQKVDLKSKRSTGSWHAANDICAVHGAARCLFQV